VVYETHTEIFAGVEDELDRVSVVLSANSEAFLIVEEIGRRTLSQIITVI
jgi:hypothetical protein